MAAGLADWVEEHGDIKWRSVLKSGFVRPHFAKFDSLPTGDYLLFILTAMDSIQNLQILSPVMLPSNSDPNSHCMPDSSFTPPKYLQTALGHIHLWWSLRWHFGAHSNIAEVEPDPLGLKDGFAACRGCSERPVRLNDQTHSLKTFAVRSYISSPL